MDEATYRKWWPLHLRAAKGETLNADEQAFYEARLRELHAEESLQFDVAFLRQMRKELVESRGALMDLRRQHDDLERQVREMEAALPLDTRRALGIAE
ncbi:MAG: hypothetical protein ACRDJN_04665 [Chloroflexota bacterium]